MQALHREVVDQSFSWGEASRVAVGLLGYAMPWAEVRGCQIFVSSQPPPPVHAPHAEVVVPAVVIQAGLQIPIAQWEPLAHEMAHAIWLGNCWEGTLPGDVRVRVCHTP